MTNSSLKEKARTALALIKTFTDEQKRTREKMLRDGVNGYEVLEIIKNNET